MLIPCDGCGAKWETEFSYCGAFVDGVPYCDECLSKKSADTKIVDPVLGSMILKDWLAEVKERNKTVERTLGKERGKRL